MWVSFSSISKETSEEERVKALFFHLFFSLIGGDYEQNKAYNSRKIQWKTISGGCISRCISIRIIPVATGKIIEYNECNRTISGFI